MIFCIQKQSFCKGTLAIEENNLFLGTCFSVPFSCRNLVSADFPETYKESVLTKTAEKKAEKLRFPSWNAKVLTPIVTGANVLLEKIKIKAGKTQVFLHVNDQKL